jgi:[acyl-carrier-protein] S-malonyltransferase
VCRVHPVINNVDVAVEDQPGRIKDALVRQAYSPVRWIETRAGDRPAWLTHVFECGPGKVLAGMTKRIEGGLRAARSPTRPVWRQAQDHGA